MAQINQCSGIFQYDPSEGDDEIFTLVGYIFDRLKNFFPLDNFHRILAVLKQIRHFCMIEIIAFLFQFEDLLAPASYLK